MLPEVRVVPDTLSSIPTFFIFPSRVPTRPDGFDGDDNFPFARVRIFELIASWSIGIGHSFDGSEIESFVPTVFETLGTEGMKEFMAVILSLQDKLNHSGCKVDFSGSQTGFEGWCLRNV